MRDREREARGQLREAGEGLKEGMNQRRGRKERG